MHVVIYKQTTYQVIKEVLERDLCNGAALQGNEGAEAKGILKKTSGVGKQWREELVRTL